METANKNELTAVNINKWQPLLRQVYISSSAWIVFFTVGLSLGTPTVSIPQLRKEANTTASVSDEMASWISSIAGFSGVIWTVILTIATHKYGRKKVVLIVAVNDIIAFVVLYCSRHATDVFVSEALLGAATASSVTVCILVMAEYASPKYRGIVLTLKSATFFWGIWVANAIGAFYNYRNIGLLGIICSVYVLIITLIMPESPYWLASKGKYKECVASHRWLKGVDDDEEKELEVLIENQKEINSHKKEKKSLVIVFIQTMRNVSKPEMYKPFFISTLVILMYHCSGKLVCTLYSIQMFQKITGSESTAYTGMLVLDGVTVVGMYIGCGLSKILKRRTLLLTASIIGSFCLYIMSVYVYLIKCSLIAENNYVTIGLLTAFSLAICCGPMILSLSIHAELIPFISRSFYVAVIGCFTYLVLSTVLKLSPYVFYYCGFDGTFLVFALLSTILIILVYRFLPETKDKTLLEIRDLFKTEKLTSKTTELELLNKGNSSTVMQPASM